MKSNHYEEMLTFILSKSCFSSLKFLSCKNVLFVFEEGLSLDPSREPIVTRAKLSSTFYNEFNKINIITESFIRKLILTKSFPRGIQKVMQFRQWIR